MFNEAHSPSKRSNAEESELESVLKTHLKEHDELLLDGVRYRMFNTSSHEYPLNPTLAVLSEATGTPRDELLCKLGVVDKKALEGLLKELGKKLEKPRVKLLKAELEAKANKHQSPRFWAKEVA